MNSEILMFCIAGIGVQRLRAITWRRGRLDRFLKVLSHCPAAERAHWLRQPLAR